jgi:hypothetical protein
MANEHLHSNPERLADSQEAAAERDAELLKRQERTHEIEDNESRASAERKEIESLFESESSAEAKRARMDQSGPPKGRQKSISKKERDASYKKIMNDISQEMSPAERVFSKFIHSPAVEKTSDVLGKTVARPNSILIGSLSAFILVTAVYMIARSYGYRLSGFETIATFALGWLIGLIIDFLRAMARGKVS